MAPPLTYRCWARDRSLRGLHLHVCQPIGAVPLMAGILGQGFNEAGTLGWTAWETCWLQPVPEILKSVCFGLCSLSDMPRHHAEDHICHWFTSIFLNFLFLSQAFCLILSNNPRLFKLFTFLHHYAFLYPPYRRDDTYGITIQSILFSEEYSPRKCLCLSPLCNSG